MFQRTVKITVDETFPKPLHDYEVERAVGYLATWGIRSERYRDCSIFADRRGEITATYRDASGAVTYVIGAIPDSSDGKYSFHS